MCRQLICESFDFAMLRSGRTGKVPQRVRKCTNLLWSDLGRQNRWRIPGNNGDCERRIFLAQYHNTGRLPAVKRQIVAMALNGSGIHDTARVLGVSPTMVISTFRPMRTTTPNSLYGRNTTNSNTRVVLAFITDYEEGEKKHGSK